MIMEEGKIVVWFKKEGEQVEKGEPLVEIETEKAAGDVEAPVAGTLVKAVAQPGETVPVGALLGVILADGEDADAALKAAEEFRLEKSVLLTPDEPGQIPTRPRSGRRGRISPAAKKFAEDHHLDWEGITGSGPNGRIMIQDVKSALTQSPEDLTVSRQAIPLSPLRKAIARRTKKSIEAPQAALCREIDMTRLLEARRDGVFAPHDSTGRGVSLTAILIKAMSAILREIPILNALLVDDRIQLIPTINIGVVVEIKGGIAVPVIRDTQRKTVREMSTELSRITGEARENTLSERDLTEGTCTISNAGTHGIDLFQPLLNPPEVAALGIGRIREKPIVKEGIIKIGNQAFFCLSTDHRAADAGPAGKFLTRIDEILQHPIDLSQ